MKPSEQVCDQSYNIIDIMAEAVSTAATTTKQTPQDDDDDDHHRKHLSSDSDDNGSSSSSPMTGGGGDAFGVARTPLHQSSSSTSTTTTTTHRQEKAPAWVIRQQPSHVFTGESFTVEYSLEMPDSSTNTSPPPNIEIKVSLESPTPGGNLVVVQEPRYSSSRQAGSVMCQITDAIAAGSCFTIKVDTKGNLGITAAMTKKITVVQAKLRLQTADDWSNVWFKDEGGREKSMEVTVSAVNADNEVWHEDISLSTVLCYENGKVPVMNQDILRLLGRTLHISKLTGQTKIRFRVEDVSKNHQGQGFCLLIKPKGHDDIAPCATPAVTIRSKRNKRHRSSTTTTTTTTAAAAAATSSFADARTAAAFAAATAETPQQQERLREAVTGVIRWTDEVIHGIYPLQWQVMGYAHNPDGSLDYNRPYHNMHNPNAFISRILASYNESTRDHIQVLRRAVEPFPVLYEPPVFGGGGYAHPMQHFLPPGAMQQQQQPNMPPSMPPSMPPPPKRTDFPFYVEPPVYRQQPHPPPPPQQQQQPRPTKPEDEEGLDEAAVEYVLAKEFKGFATGENLGFPAYAADKQICGFYQESPHGGVGEPRQFVSIRRHAAYFGPAEFRQATDILQRALAEKSKAVHALKDWGSIANLLDHALVYDWSKDIGNNTSSGSGEL